MQATRYSIKDLEKLSGIKAHTIRIWEQRYKLLKPRRTSTNIRYYTDLDLRKILNVSLLLTSGMKISSVASLTDASLHKEVQALRGTGYEQAYEINEFIDATLRMNETDFEKCFSNSVLKHGVKETITEIIYPFLNRIGYMWGTGDMIPAQEHFASQLIRQKLFTALNGKSVNDRSSQRFMLFLPEHEQHEIPLLFSQYILREKRISTIYLGANVPRENILTVAKSYKPTHLLTFLITRSDPAEFVKFLSFLKQHFSEKHILVGGAAELLHTLPKSQKITYLTDPASLVKII